MARKSVIALALLVCLAAGVATALATAREPEARLISAYKATYCDSGTFWFINKGAYDAMIPKGHLVHVWDGAKWRCAIVAIETVYSVAGTELFVDAEVVDCEACDDI